MCEAVSGQVYFVGMSHIFPMSGIPGLEGCVGDMTKRQNMRKYMIGAAACLVLGLACGALWVNALEGEAFRAYVPNAAAYWLDMPQGESLRTVWIEAFVKHARLLAAIWVLAFCPRVSRAAYVVCAVKGAGVGFVLGLFGRAFGVSGIWRALALAGLPCVVILPAAVFAAAACRMYDEKQLGLRLYAIIGGALMLAAALTAGVEALVIPRIF